MAFPFFCSTLLQKTLKELEVYADAKFHGAGESSFRRKLAKLCGWGRDAEVGSQELVVVQNIDEIDRGFKTEALHHSYVLLYAKVHIPVGQTAELAKASAVTVKTQN